VELLSSLLTTASTPEIASVIARLHHLTAPKTCTCPH
jgi:hypothetical protein